MPFKHPSKSLRIFAYSTRWLVSKNIHTADAAPIPHLSARLPRSLPADSSEDTTNDMFAHAVMCFDGVLDRQDGAMLVVMNIWMIGRDNSAKEDDGGVEKVHE
ncbi:hypothetical protein BELL_0466g00070 [Botrytis elliptica]|uniref:Uncharacterized protein n=1 Tax=Botrytis elliptica TaxID=278938 RepID=A0A4Z1JTX8_9HELO|nr:hypothetical protein BELL_0466g00070 [Botrytis elliptica]